MHLRLAAREFHFFKFFSYMCLEAWSLIFRKNKTERNYMGEGKELPYSLLRGKEGFVCRRKHNWVYFVK